MRVLAAAGGRLLLPAAPAGGAERWRQMLPGVMRPWYTRALSLLADGHRVTQLHQNKWSIKLKITSILASSYSIFFFFR